MDSTIKEATTNKQTTPPLLKELNIDKIKDLPKDGKRAITKGLSDIGFSQRRISELTGIGLHLVNNYIHDSMSKDWELFRNGVKNLWFEQDTELSQLAFNRIKETMPQANLYQAIGLLKTVREFNITKGNEGISISGNQVAVQVVRGTTSNNEPNNEAPEAT